MEIRKVLVHSCFQRKKGFNEDTPLSPEKCRCKQFIPVQEAAAFVQRGLAQYVVVSEKITQTSEVCDICAGVDGLKKSCKDCGGTGVVLKTNKYRVRGEDIIFISQDGKRNTKTTQVKKSPTIEKAHIERAYVNGNRVEQARIEAYGISTKEFIASLFPAHPYEPEDNQRKRTGRRYDWGRAI